MEEIRVKNVKIKAKAIRDTKGRKGYFIADTDLRKNRNIEIVHLPSKKVRPSTKVSPEAKQILDELRDYKDGKVKLRSIDEFLKTL